MILTKLSVIQVLVGLNYSLRGQRPTYYLIQYHFIKNTKATLCYHLSGKKKETYALTFETAKMYHYYFML